MNTIISTLNTQLENLANETAIDILSEIPTDELDSVTNEGEAIELLHEAVEADNAFNEAFQYFDMYYQTTAGRGNPYEVACVLREAITEELGCFEFDFDTDEDAILLTANTMVNIYAEVCGPQLLSISGETLLETEIPDIIRSRG